MCISFGLENPCDTYLTSWVATILGPPGTTHENRFYTLRVVCGVKYPVLPPAVTFVSKIDMNCVDQTSGKVPCTHYAVLVFGVNSLLSIRWT